MSLQMIHPFMGDHSVMGNSCICSVAKGVVHEASFGPIALGSYTWVALLL